MAPRRIAVAPVLVLCAALLLVAAAPASAVTRKQAASKAVAALGSKQGTEPVVVFGLTKPLRKGTHVTQLGSKKLVGTASRDGAFFFYEDSAPGKPFPHAGRVALVGSKTGKVKLSRTLTRTPLVNGELPAFLTSPNRYRSAKYRVYERAASADSTAGTVFALDPVALDEPTEPAGPSGPNSPPTAHPQDVLVKQDRAKNITLTGSDDDGDFLVFTITNPPDHGTLSGSAPDVTYTPDPGYLGKDDFHFKTLDDEAQSNSAKVSITVAPRGLAPTVLTSSGCTAYTERAAAVAVDGSVLVADLDDTHLDSARVRVSANFARGDDLLFTDQNGISGSYDDVTGELLLTGTAPVATYQAALRTVRYRNLAGGDPAPTKDIEFTVNDAGGDSAPATKQVCITHTGSNSRPVGETSEGALLYIENDGPVPVDGGFVAQDTDSTNLSGATIKFVASQGSEEEEVDPTGPGGSTNAFAPDEDELAFTDQNGITGTYDDTLGVLTLTGSATVADYEAAIRSVTYENTSEDPSDQTRALRFQVTDSTGLLSVPSSRGVLVTPVNDAPVVTTSDGSATATGADPATVVDSGLTTLDVDDDDLEGARVSIASGLEAGDELAFTDQLGISGSYDSETGVLTLTGTASVADYETALRTVEYRHPGGNPSGARVVEFVVNDGDLDSGPASRGIEVNDAPVLDTTDAALSYTEGDGAVAVDSGITVSDGDSATLVGASVQISTEGDPAEDELVFTDQNGITGFRDEESGILFLTGSASVADYQAALRSITYENDSEDPTAGIRTVSFQVDDGALNNNTSNQASRDVDVIPVNDAPTVTTTAGSVAYTEGDPATTVDSGVTVADVDDSDIEGASVKIASGFDSGDALVFVDQLGISGVYNTGTGVLTLTGTASVADYETALRSIAFSGTSDNPTASKSVEFVVNDGEDDSNTASRSIAVTPVNDAPSVTTSSGSTAYTEGDPATTVDSGVTVADVDDSSLASAQVKIASGFDSGDALVFVDQLGISGVYNTATGVLTLTGAASVADYETALRSIAFSGTSDNPAASKSVEFSVNDGDVDSNTASRSIAVTSVNDAPSVTTSSGSTAYTVGDPAATVDSALTVADVDDASLEGATVKIASGFDSGDDLVFVNQAGISGVYNTGTGVLTLTGTATVAEYEAALRSIAFGTVNESPTTPKSVEFTVTDGDADSAVASKSIDVSPAPQPEP